MGRSENLPKQRFDAKKNSGEEIYMQVLTDVNNTDQSPFQFSTDILTVRNIPGAPNIMKQVIANLNPQSPTPSPLLSLPREFDNISWYLTHLGRQNIRILGFYKDIPILADLTGIVRLDYADEDDSACDVSGLITLKMGMGTSRVCFCFGTIQGTGIGIFISEYKNTYLATPPNADDPPWNGLEGNAGAFVVFDEHRKMWLQFDCHD